MPFLNKKRLLVYPILVLIPLWIVTIINVASIRGWFGGFGGYIGYDFLSFYSGGKMFVADTVNLYNEEAVANLQNQLTGLPKSGLNFFVYPPYAALFYSLFSALPYLAALILWTVLSIASLVVSGILIFRYLVPEELKKNGATQFYILALIFSFYPVVFGLQNGQNNTFTLLLVTLIIVFVINKRPFLAGISAGVLLLKPQFLVGWIILWLWYKNYKTLAAFAVTGAAWVGASILYKGINPYIEYLRYIPRATSLYIGGHAWDVTPLAIINRFFVFIFKNPNLLAVTLVVFICLVIGMVVILRRYPSAQHPVPMILAILIPFLFFHLLLYDILAVILLFCLWSQLSQSKTILYTAVVIYLLTLILPPICAATEFPFMGTLPVIILIAMGFDLHLYRKLPKENFVPA